MPLISNAPDLAVDLPHMPPINKSEKDVNPDYIIHQKVNVCDESYSLRRPFLFQEVAVRGRTDRLCLTQISAAQTDCC